MPSRFAIAALFCWVVSQPPARARSDAGRDAASAAAHPKAPATYSRVALSTRCVEDLLGLAELDEVAEVHERDAVGDPARLLEVVRDDHDREVLAQLEDELLDHGSRARVERGARLVHQQDLGLAARSRGRCTGAAAGRRRGVSADRSSVVADLPVKSGALAAPGRQAARSRAGAAAGVTARAAQTPTLSKIDIGNGFGCWKTIETRRAQLGVDDLVDVLAVEQDPAAVARARRQLGEAVERAQQRRLAAAGRADQREHLALVDRQRDVPDRRLLAVEDADVLQAQTLDGALGSP